MFLKFDLAPINMAIKQLKQKYNGTIAFYRDILKLEVNEVPIDNPTASKIHSVQFENNII